MIQVFTDGSTRRNGTDGAPGAWGYVAYKNGERIAKCGELEKDATNQRMELLGLIRGCEWATANANGENVEFCSDSAYCVRAINEGWIDKWLSNGWQTANRMPVKNKDLWQLLVPYLKRDDFFFTKVKGHGDCEGNIEVDKLVQGLTLGR